LGILNFYGFRFRFGKNIVQKRETPGIRAERKKKNEKNQNDFGVKRGFPL